MAEGILNSLREQGVLSESGQEKLLSYIPEEAREKLSNLFQRYRELGENEKEELMTDVVAKFKQSLQDKMLTDTSVFTNFFHSHPYIVFLLAVLLVIVVLVFFVYKLFKCLTERETKREEKKKNKQMKKKK